MVYNILDYGAVPDGLTKATKAIQAAINDCTKTGGQVLVPSGRFLSVFWLMLFSNLSLQLPMEITMWMDRVRTSV